MISATPPAPPGTRGVLFYTTTKPHHLPGTGNMIIIHLATGKYSRMPL